MSTFKIQWKGNVPYSGRFHDIYFSLENGLEESRYVFLEPNGLSKRFKRNEIFSLVELGFGTGLNFLLTAHEFLLNNSSGYLNYIGIEKYPLELNHLKNPFTLGEKN